MFTNDIHKVKQQIENEGFCVLKNLISIDLINNFSSMIEEIEKDIPIRGHNVDLPYL